METCTVHLLCGASLGVSEASEGGKMVRYVLVRLQLKALHKVLRAVALRSIGWTRHFCWSILGMMSANNLGNAVEACLKVEKCAS